MKWLAAIPFVGLTVLCWGLYGPVLHRGQMAMENSRLRPLLCVGAAYFVIGVVVPIAILATRGEEGGWTAGGIFWSSAAGAAGAIGALGIILAFKMGGAPHWVMPLVFGGAPIVNAFFAMAMTGTYRQLRDHPIFLAGLIIVSIGAFMVLFFAPKGAPHAPSQARAVHEQPAKTPPAESPLKGS